MLGETDLISLKFRSFLLTRCGFAQYLPCVFLTGFGFVIPVGHSGVFLCLLIPQSCSGLSGDSA